MFLGVLAARPPGSAEPRPRRAPAGGARGLRSRWERWRSWWSRRSRPCPPCRAELTDDALSQAASNTKADLDAAGEKAALAKRLDPFAVEPLFAQASIAERGNQPKAAAALLVEAVERQPDNPATWTRLARFQVLLDDSGGRPDARSSRPRQLDPAAFAVYSLLPFARYDERRSASATGTPLPLEVTLPALTPAPARARAGRTPPGAPPVPLPLPPRRPRRRRRPAPAPAPRAPTPTPREPAPPPPSGEPFRFEG